jgi:hypothetical protein
MMITLRDRVQKHLEESNAAPSSATSSSTDASGDEEESAI